MGGLQHFQMWVIFARAIPFYDFMSDSIDKGVEVLNLHGGNSKDVRQEKSVVRKSLGEALKVHRTQCKMTQEFVAETIGVSRQAVSKWENGTSDPSTSNLFALAKLYGISVEELLKEVE